MKRTKYGSKNKTPISWEDFKRKSFITFIQWFNKKSIIIKIIIVLLMVLLFAATARFHLIGNTAYQFSKVIFPFYIWWIDPPFPVIPTTFWYDIENSNGRRSGKLGDICRSDDRIYLSFKMGIDCFVSVFSLDPKGIYPIFNNKLDPSYVKKDYQYTLNFKLDHTSGQEIYYIVASLDAFKFNKDILPAIPNYSKHSISKGPEFSNYSLVLPRKFTSQVLHCKHL